MNIKTSARELMERGLWNEACEVTGMNPYALNEGRMNAEDEITLTERQATRIGLLPSSMAPACKAGCHDGCIVYPLSPNYELMGVQKCYLCNVYDTDMEAAIEYSSGCSFGYDHISIAVGIDHAINSEYHSCPST